MTRRLAQCACGRLQLRCEGDPLRVSLCHCTDCQRRTGSAFGIAAFFARNAVTVLQGLARDFTRDSASGKMVTFHFCPDCGSTLFWEPERLPQLVAVAVGAFADPAFPAPEQSVWTDCKHDWLTLPSDMPAYAIMPRPQDRGS